MRLKVVLASTLLCLSSSANAGLIATAHGIVTQGCNDCSGSGQYDTFGFGSNADLAGYSLTIQYHISDEFLARAPSLNSEGFLIHWSSEVPLGLTGSITVNDRTFNLPTNWPIIPMFGYTSDGDARFYLVNEDYALPEGMSSDDFSSYHYDSLNSTGSHEVRFLSQWSVNDRSNGPDGFVRSSYVWGTIGDFTFSAAADAVRVPEPSSMLLFSIALVGFRLSRRRDRQQTSGTIRKGV